MSTAPRVKRLRNLLNGKGLDGVLISSDNNRRYLSGFTGSAGYLLITDSDSILATDFRYVDQAKQQAPEFSIERISGKSEWFPNMARETGANKIGFEDQEMTVSTYSVLQKAICASGYNGIVELTRVGGSIDQLRGIKDCEEMALLAHAVKITDEAFEEVAPKIKPGVTEEKIALDLEIAMRELGAGGMAFDIIVGSGLNAAMPHHRADKTIVSGGHPLVIDMGASYEGYCADLTRTIMVGEPDDKFKKIYDIVLRAQVEAEETARSGMLGSELDKIARDIIAKSGYADNFGHSLGHGVGLAVHEFPHIGPNARDILEDGMMFTIEPGIYLPEWGGVRIEDIVVMENGKASIVSQATKIGDTA